MIGEMLTYKFALNNLNIKKSYKSEKTRDPMASKNTFYASVLSQLKSK